MSAISIKNLHKQLGKFRLKDINLEIPKGYITGLIGENGAGKSVLLNHLLTLKKADSGKVVLLGSEDIEEDRSALLNRIGFVFAEDNFPQNYTPGKLEKILRIYYENWQSDVFSSYLQTFKVNKNSRISKLSTGEKVKLSIAIALSHQAELLILDEPTSNLDPTFRMELLSILQELLIDENITILFSTHITSDLENIADYIIMIDEGEVLFNREKDRIFEKYKKVKGSKEILDQEVNELLIGKQENALGFTAMTEEPDALQELFGKKVVIEVLTIEEMMFFIKQDKRGGSDG